MIAAKIPISVAILILKMVKVYRKVQRLLYHPGSPKMFWTGEDRGA